MALMSINVDVDVNRNDSYMEKNAFIDLNAYHLGLNITSVSLCEMLTNIYANSLPVCPMLVRVP